MQPQQMPLPLFTEHDPQLMPENIIERIYTTDDLTDIKARVELEQCYADLLVPTGEFNRRLVSYQANKTTRLHRWVKYKEGFSAQLVHKLLDEFLIQSGEHLLDPFAGSGTTLLVGQERGIHATGIELLPPCHLMWAAKTHYTLYDLVELERIRKWIRTTSPGKSSTPFPHIPITESAFPNDSEAQFMWYMEQIDELSINQNSRTLLKALLMSVLEDVSYTRKDGQYLRWDSRSTKARKRDAKRISSGKKPYKTFHKTAILSVKDALLAAIDQVIEDVRVLRHKSLSNSNQHFIQDTALQSLPNMAANQFQAVITSPPYCNRYDYTRTYALELAFLGSGHENVIQLRQDQLSCTVENRSKLEQLCDYYDQIGRPNAYQKVVQSIETNKALQEVFLALEKRSQNGDLNNKGVVQMVRGYFTELAFIIFELYRVCATGAQVAIVNDNVRYGGEIIPVDLLLMDIAASFGFKPTKIYVLPQRKGNSSQQMGRFGREALRKSILVWQK
jgi:site-specific DNA-methyltransferase (cytosine-N4-specific)